MQQKDLTFHQVNPFEEYELTKNTWLNIEKKSNTSFYLSWIWMANWLKCLSSDENIIFVYASYNNTPVFCYFLGIQKQISHKIIYSPRAYLNKTGNKRKDSITVEYNGILVDKDFQQTEFTEVFEKSNDWYELVAGFVSPHQVKYFNHQNPDFNCRIESEEKGFYVDLEAVRKSNNDLLPLLSKNKRSQIKRSMKAYAKEGDIRLENIKQPDDIINAINNLKELHQKAWQKKGLPGAFSNKFFTNFHEKLISNKSNSNNIDFINLYSGNTLIGSLYNFLFNNQVYFYQSGFEYRSENIYKPGLITHYLAINHYASLGYQTYDLLVGELDYKKSISSHSYPMPSYRLRTNKLRFKLEDSLRYLKSKI